MALATQALAAGGAVVTPTAFAAPTTSEPFSYTPGQFLWVKNGATPCTVTITRPGTFPAGDTNTTYTTGAITSVERVIPISADMRSPTTGLVTVAFSAVTTVTALLITVTQ
jgi:hypothetical protein